MSARHRHVRVLCIGDDPIRLNLRCSFLREQGFEVSSSGSGYQGLIQFAENGFEAVVLDVDGGGAESALIAGELRRVHPTLPIILMVADGSVADGIRECASMLVSRQGKPDTLSGALKDLLKSDKRDGDSSGKPDGKRGARRS